VREGAIQVLIGASEIARRTAELGAQIGADYLGRGSNGLLLVGLLKGASFFLADLVRAIPTTLAVDYDFISISRYGTAGDRSARILMDLEASVRGRDVLLVKDVFDTGLAIAYIQRVLRVRQPASLRTCVLLDRQSVRLIDIPLDYVGFSLPDRFVVGYGMDLHERYRNLPYIGVLPADAARPTAVRMGELAAAKSLPGERLGWGECCQRPAWVASPSGAFRRLRPTQHSQLAALSPPPARSTATPFVDRQRQSELRRCCVEFSLPQKCRPPRGGWVEPARSSLVPAAGRPGWHTPSRCC